MQTISWQDFSERVTYDDELHVACVPLPAAMGDSQLAAMREGNLSVLQTLAVFGERHGAPPDEESPVAQELLRLDGKINVLMAMLDQLLRRETELPPRLPVSFNAVGAVLPTAAWPAGEMHALLRLHFDGCLALPLQLPVRRVQERDANHILVAFESMDDVTCDALERLVFRHHRRKVAGRRLTTS